MNTEVVSECSRLSDQEKIVFPEVISRLNEANIVSYYADFLAACKTYYSKTEAHVVPSLFRTEDKIAQIFSADKIAQAIQHSQLGKIRYQEFIKQIKAAGVVSYFVFIEGRKAMYFGRLGEQHIENFPN
ncbi:MAG: DUF1398 family protein [Parachlamydiaceae bacterium]|nr:DUF1398 family protein [Parachlamydiaceae bacterium]